MNEVDSLKDMYTNTFIELELYRKKSTCNFWNIKANIFTLAQSKNRMYVREHNKKNQKKNIKQQPKMSNKSYTKSCYKTTDEPALRII